MSTHPSQRLSGRNYRRADARLRTILNEGLSTTGINSPGEEYRAVEGTNATSTTIASPEPSVPASSNRDPPRGHPRESRSRTSQAAPSIPSTTIHRASLPPLRSVYRRAPEMPNAGGTGASRAGRFQWSDRLSVTQRSLLDYDTSNLTDLAHSLEDANSHLRALLDSSPTASTDEAITPSLNPSYTTPSVQNHDGADDGRRIKRRRLDSQSLPSPLKGFRYGRYGQVEPGKLNMEIESCDGGMFSEPTYYGTSYAVENILKNDDSVYCTKGNRCNIILKHQGATAFSLKELIIKGPQSNYSAPVREGMVFVSMKNDDVLLRTSQYQIQYRSVRLSAQPSLERETGPLAPILSIRHNDDGSIMTRAQVRQRRLRGIGADGTDLYSSAQIPSEFTVPPPPFQVTTECSGEGADDFPPPPRYFRLRRAPNLIGSLPFESDSSDDGWAVDESASDETARLARYPRRAPAPAEAPDASRPTTSAVGGELLAPHAKFYIERGKNRCTICFDPPVSGRFILLKMWNPHQDQSDNIDIQGVVAKGFAGPRYFPAVELR